MTQRITLNKPLLSTYLSNTNVPEINKRISSTQYSSLINSSSRNEKLNFLDYKKNSIEIKKLRTNSVNFILNSTTFKSQNFLSNSNSQKSIYSPQKKNNNKKLMFSPLNKINYIERKKIRSMTNIKSENPFLNENNGVNFKLFNDEKINEKIGIKRNKNLSLLTKNIYTLIPNKVKFSLESKNIKLNNLTDLFKKDKTKISSLKYSIKTLRHITIINKINRQKENFYKKFLQIKGNKYLKRLIRLKILKILWEQNALLMEQLIIFYHLSKWFFIENNFWSQKKFQEFTKISNLRADDDFINQLFLIFSFENKNEKINIIEVLCYFILTTNKTNQEKIKEIIQLIQDTEKEKIKNKNLISVQRFINFFHPIFNSYFNSNSIIHFHKKLKGKYDKELLNKNILLNEIYDFQTIENGIQVFYDLYINIDKNLNKEFQNLLSVYNQKALNFFDINKIGDNYYLYKLLDKILDSMIEKNTIMNNLKKEK